MGSFLEELRELLKKHNATILRSARDGELVVSVMPRGSGTMLAEEEAFQEDISNESIKHGWHSPFA